MGDIRTWHVYSFDENTLVGTVESSAGDRLRFHSTSFQASTHRWPRAGERVEVAFTKAGELLSVHGDPPAECS